MFRCMQALLTILIDTFDSEHGLPRLLNYIFKIVVDGHNRQFHFQVRLTKK